MKGTHLSSGRPADGQKRIIEELRGQIVAGDFSPGERLPPRIELGRRFGAGATTVQRALDLLTEDGFIQSRGNQGTFVVENPPHLTRYAIVHMQSLTEVDKHINHFSKVLNHEVQAYAQTRSEFELVQYFGVDGHTDGEDYQRLIRDILAERVAGIMFTSNPYNLANSIIVEHPNIPRVAIMERESAEGWPAVALDRRSFFSRALHYLKEQGRIRVAFVVAHNSNDLDAEDKKVLAELGMETRLYWCQWSDLNSPCTAQNAIHAVLRCTDRPDAVIIADDNMAEFALQGIVDSGVSVPEELTIVTHSNFPYPVTSDLPLQRFGYDVGELVQTCIENLIQQRQGHQVPALTSIAAISENEVLNRSNTHLI